MKNKVISIILVDDHDILRHGLKKSLDEKIDIKVLKECSNGRDAVRAAEQFCPNVMIMDINMPDLNGIEAARQILGRNPEIKIISLSMLCDEQSVMRMLDAGARGFLLKTCSFDELYDSIRQIVSGKTCLCAEAREIVIENALNPVSNKNRSPLSKLTPRERETLQLIAEGNTSKEIAEAIKVTKRTVDIHRANLMKKLQIKTVAGLTRFAIKEGIIPI